MMNKIFDYIKNASQLKKLASIIVFLCIILLLLNNCQRPKEKVIEKIKVEYVIKHDTITIEKPVPIVEYKYKTIRDTLYIENKPIEVEIPISQKVYSDPNYTAYVSGYKPNLDSIKLYRKDSLIYTTIEREKIKYRNDYSRNAIGVNIGASTIINNGKIEVVPAVSVGWNINFIRWRKR